MLIMINFKQVLIHQPLYIPILWLVEVIFSQCFFIYSYIYYITYQMRLLLFQILMVFKMAGIFLKQVLLAIARFLGGLISVIHSQQALILIQASLNISICSQCGQLCTFMKLVIQSFLT